MEQTDQMERIIRLEQVVRALVENNSTVQALRDMVSPFGDKEGWIHGCPDRDASFRWDEEHIFNETRLYKALGKDDARSVLGVWNRFRRVCELIAVAEE